MAGLGTRPPRGEARAPLPFLIFPSLPSQPPSLQLEAGAAHRVPGKPQGRRRGQKWLSGGLGRAAAAGGEPSGGQRRGGAGAMARVAKAFLLRGGDGEGKQAADPAGGGGWCVEKTALTSTAFAGGAAAPGQREDVSGRRQAMEGRDG